MSRASLATTVLALNRAQAADVPGPLLWRAGRVVVTAVVVGTNLVGVAAVVLLATFVVPLPGVGQGTTMGTVDAALTAGYVVVAVTVGVIVGTSGLGRLRRWLLEDRPATVADQRVVLRAPLRLFVLQLLLWWVAAVVFGIVDGTTSGVAGARLAVTVALTGASTAACAYLLTERVLRPTAARALAQGVPERLAVPGVAARAVLAWALGTGVPVAGVVALGVLGLQAHAASAHRLAVAMVVLGAVALTVGLLAVTVAARATADPVDAVRGALDRVQRGDLSARVPVFDGTQVGRLQAGFNAMVAGLAERERIRELFGTYVDRDVAERILVEGTSVDGEDVEVTVMFVDVRDFTAFAERQPARVVVAALNDLFATIVPIVHAHGGHVDKFVGDGLLAVFGAPRRLPDHGPRAVAAALAIAEVTAGGADGDGEGPPGGPVGRLPVGIGLNSGMVVAGSVGGAGRFEFGVIGDVVNTAARVEAATRQTGDTVLIGAPTAALVEEALRDGAPASGGLVEGGEANGGGGPAACGDLGAPGDRRSAVDAAGLRAVLQGVHLVERPGVSLKGKHHPVALYAVVRHAAGAEASPPAPRAAGSAVHTGISPER